MQTNYKSLADIKKRVPTVNDLQSPYHNNGSYGASRPVKHELSAADAWLYRIVMIGLSAGILKVIISTCFR